MYTQIVHINKSAPEMDVKGNNNSIMDGDTTPSATDYTDFGSADVSSGTVDRVFTIENTGTADLRLTNTPKVSISGANASDFSVTSDPASPVIPSDSTTFTIQFNPSAAGVRTATISIANNDADENPYNFDIQGTGIASTKDITAFSFASPEVAGVISGANITVTVPFGTDVTALVPTITHSGASVSPNSGVVQNFLSPVTYTVTAEDASTKDYLVTVVIPITVTANAGQNKIFGEVDAAIAYTSSNPVTFTGALTRTDGEDVGTYPISQGTLAVVGSNYSINFVSNNFSITPKPITVTASVGQSKVFGEGDPTFAYTSSDPAATFTGALSRSPGEDVGTYTIGQGSLVIVGINYSISFVPGNFSITSKPITVTANIGQTKAFGTADPTFAYTSSDPAATFTGALDRTAGEDVGTYAIGQGTLALDGNNYSISFIPNNFSITPKPITIIADIGQTKVFGTGDPTFVFTSSDPVTFTGSLGRAPGEDVGTYAITQGNLALVGSNYSINFVSNNFSITPKPIMVTANGGQSKVLGDPDPAFTYISSDPAATFTGTLDRISGEDIGTYTIGQGSLTVAGNNYAITTFVPADFTIMPAKAITSFGFTSPAVIGVPTGTNIALTVPPGTDVTALVPTITHTGKSISPESGVPQNFTNPVTYTVTADDESTQDFLVTVTVIQPITVTANIGQSKVFGAIDPTFAYTSSDPTVTFTGALARTSGEDVGTYPIGQGTLDAGANYAITFVSNDFSITPKPVMVTANAGQTKVFGTGDPSFAYTSSDPAATFTGALTRSTGEDVGTYPIAQGTLEAGINYTITFVSSNFSISPNLITVTANGNQSKVFGAADPTFTYTSSDPAVTLTGALARETGEDVGTYAITQGTLDAGTNYAIAFDSNNFSIIAKPITVTVEVGQSKVFGSVDPSFAYTSSDPATSFTGALTRTSGEDVGTYAIGQGTLAVAGNNYSMSFVSNNFFITPKPITVTVNAGQAKIFGADDPTYAYTSSDTVTFSGALDRVAGENVGTYAIGQGSLAIVGNNYSMDFVSNNFTITAKPITVTAKIGQSKVFGAADPTISYTSSDPAVTFTGALARTSGEDVGTYGIGQGTLDAGTNYEITFVSNDFSITAKSITVTANGGQSKVFGAAEPTFTYASSDPAATFSGGLDRAAGEDVGIYAIGKGTLDAGTNYEITFVSNDFSITTKPITVTANVGQSKLLGAAEPSLAYTSSDPAATFTGTLARVPGEQVGAYAIQQGTLSVVGSNYVISTFVPANFTILPAKTITTFSFSSPAVIGTINEAAHTITITVPYGTNVTALVATFSTTGSSVKVGTATQVSGTTANNFRSPVTYTVTAADASTQPYVVTVTVAPKIISATFRSSGSGDGWVLESSENSEVGGSKNSNTDTFNLGDDAQNRQFRSILNFPTSYLPDNAVITEVKLMFKKQGVVGTDPFTTHQNISVDIRKGLFVKYNFFTFGSFQLENFQAPADLYSVGTIQNNPVNNWYSTMLDITAFPYINLTGGTQLRLGFQLDDDNDQSPDFIKFFSGDYEAQKERPQLQIKYFVPNK